MSRIPFRELPPNAFIRKQSDDLNRALRQLNEIGNISSPDAIFNRGPNGSSISIPSSSHETAFYGMVVNNSPDGLFGDFSDARYWVQSVSLAQNPLAVSTDTAALFNDGQFHIVGINAAESTTGTHSLFTVSPNATPGLAMPPNATLVRVSSVAGVKRTDNPGDSGNMLYFLEVVSPNTIFAAFKGRITAVTSSFPAWSYTVQRVTSYNSTLTGAARWVTDGVNIVNVLNRTEFSGTPPYTYGTGNLITSSSGQVNSTACVVQSIGIGAVPDVTATLDENNVIKFSFSEMNSSQ